MQTEICELIDLRVGNLILLKSLQWSYNKRNELKTSLKKLNDNIKTLKN